MNKMKFEFNEKKHSYTLDGKPLTGVTTILNVIAKPSLVNWAAKMATEYVANEWKPDVTYSAEAIKLILDKAETAHRRKKEKAGKAGTDIHSLIEIRIKEAIANNGFINGHNTNEEPQVSHFINWALKYNVQFLESEKRMYSENLFLAGTCDFTAIINGEKMVGDIKTGSGIYPEHFFQTAAYRMMLEEMSEKFSGSVIVNLKKDGSFNEDDDVIISYGYEEEKEAFLGALKLYRVVNSYEIKSNKKL